MKKIGWGLVILGVFFLSCFAYLALQRISPKNLAFATDSVGELGEVHTDRKPIAIIIPVLHIRLPIEPSIITNDRWPASNTGVSYLATTPLPGDIGNSVIYGHNWPFLLGTIHKLQKGDRIEILFSDRSLKSFQVEMSSVVTPHDTYILQSTDDERLTLYTCTGFLDSKRLVVTASLTN